MPTDPPEVQRPRGYTSPLDQAELPLPKVPPRPFGPTEPKAGVAKPTPPAERNPPAPAAVVLPEGRGVDRPRARVPSPPNAGAVDVPTQAWKQPDRASLDDPTADLSAVRVIETPLPLATGTLPFLRLGIPDPFELAEHLKGKMGRDAELGTTPVR